MTREAYRHAERIRLESMASIRSLPPLLAGSIMAQREAEASARRAKRAKVAIRLAFVALGLFVAAMYAAEIARLWSAAVVRLP